MKNNTARVQEDNLLESMEDNMHQTASFKKSSFDRAIQELDLQGLEFTGEQYVPGAGVEISYEHFTRYLFAQEFVRDKVVLDLGCGTGYGSLFLAKTARHVFALDRSPQCIASLEKVITKCNLQNITLVEADLNEAFKNSMFGATPIDIVVCHEFIEHISRESQRELCATVASAKSPFHTGTIFLVSTPERENYRKTLQDPNHFHEHELDAAEFRSLLEDHFSFVSTFWQGTVSANCVYPFVKQPVTNASEILEDELEFKASFIKWLDEKRHIASVASSTNDSATFMYGVASNRPLPTSPKLVALLDTKSRNIQEQMSIAGKELRTLQNLLNSAEQALENSKSNPPAPDVLAAALNSDLAKTLELQAKKIRVLLHQNEILGAQLASAMEPLTLFKEIGSDPMIVAKELLAWRELAQRRLAATPAEAEKQIDVLWSYVRAMESPLHRLILSIGTRFGNTYLGKKTKLTLRFITALIKS